MRPISLSVYPSDCSNGVSPLQALWLWAPAFAGVTTSRWPSWRTWLLILAPMGGGRHPYSLACVSLDRKSGGGRPDRFLQGDRGTQHRSVVASHCNLAGAQG